MAHLKIRVRVTRGKHHVEVIALKPFFDILATPSATGDMGGRLSLKVVKAHGVVKAYSCSRAGSYPPTLPPGAPGSMSRRRISPAKTISESSSGA
jgi:hypothetical protein